MPHWSPLLTLLSVAASCRHCRHLLPPRRTAKPTLPADADGPCSPSISGSLGFISFNDTFDLNIVIRTAVLHGDTLSIGAGGAIVVQSGAQRGWPGGGRGGRGGRGGLGVAGG